MNQNGIDKQWCFQEENMKGNGIYITASHPKYKGFILISSNRDNKKSIEDIKTDFIRFIEGSPPTI